MRSAKSVRQSASRGSAASEALGSRSTAGRPVYRPGSSVLCEDSQAEVKSGQSSGGFSTYTLVLMAVKSLQSGQFQKKTLSEECVQATLGCKQSREVWVRSGFQASYCP